MPENQTHRLMTQLKDACLPAHRRLEDQPFFKALAAGTLPIVAYVNQLRAFATAFGTLEFETKTVLDPSLRSILDFGESRFSHLLSDLSCLGEQMVPEISEAKHRAHAMASEMRLLGQENPSALLGYLYALQGTLLGNRVHLPEVQQTFNLESSRGAAFYAGYGAETDEYWGGFSNLMNALSLEKQEKEGILQAAREAFASLEAVHAALYPLPESAGTTFSATSLNPEAGNHPVPSDPREIAAAVEAGRLCRQEFPYFDARFGERGKRYASSDTAWLATLVQLPTELLLAQVAWLGGVLANRGMPRLTLERQLYYLHQELVRAVADKQEDYDKLNEGVLWLQTERTRHIPMPMAESICQQFATQTDHELSGTMQGTGRLIVSAVCDERTGIKAAVASLEPWLTSPDRFDENWIAAVREAIDRARAAVDQN